MSKRKALANKQVPRTTPATSLYLAGDAASPAPSEANAVGSQWAQYQSSTLTVDATTSVNGGYSLKQECINDTLASGWDLSFNVVNGKAYTLSCSYKSFIPGTSTREPRVYQQTNCTITTSPTNLTASTWTAFTTTVTATATGVAKVRFYTAPADGDLGNILWLDNIKIEEIIVPTPDLYNDTVATPWNITSIGSTMGSTGTMYFEYSTSGLTGSNFMTLGVNLDGGTYVVVVMGSSVANIQAKARYNYGTVKLGTSIAGQDFTTTTKVAVTWAGTTMKTYIDGTLQATDTLNDSFATSIIDSIIFQRPDETANDEFSGTSVICKLWSTELTQLQAEVITK